MPMRFELEVGVRLLDTKMKLTILRDEAEGYKEPGCRLLRCKGMMARSRLRVPKGNGEGEPWSREESGLVEKGNLDGEEEG